MDAHGDYEIIVLGQLDKSWVAWFNASRFYRTKHGNRSQMTFIFHDLDQAALHGILAKIRDLNLMLIAVKRLPIDRRS